MRFIITRLPRKSKNTRPISRIDLGNVVKDIGPLFINKAYFKGLNFVGGNYQIIVERGYYEGELPIQNLSIDDAKKLSTLLVIKRKSQFKLFRHKLRLL